MHVANCTQPGLPGKFNDHMNVQFPGMQATCSTCCRLDAGIVHLLQCYAASTSRQSR